MCFAVDFEALGHQVTERMPPHFRAVGDTMAERGPAYQVGVHGPRDVCGHVHAAGFTPAGFVSGMSTGFSGNPGYPLPAERAFDNDPVYDSTTIPLLLIEGAYEPGVSRPGLGAGEGNSQQRRAACPGRGRCP
ncbi:DUF1906 domain-containing protein [Streptomyces alfalfae]|uniref:DUF1906 domain-containing protein n=1 Tax=Streptomyces alfalfae TaxID=1642299 RepID=A0A7T4U1R8_9ACTN|nr:DUF1906 domain-containing protein [Streptomyces alfalfae]